TAASLTTMPRAMRLPCSAALPPIMATVHLSPLCSAVRSTRSDGAVVSRVVASRFQRPLSLRNDRGHVGLIAGSALFGAVAVIAAYMGHGNQLCETGHWAP